MNNDSLEEPPRVLKDWNEAQELFRKHLAPMRLNHRGFPIYRIDDVERLLKRLNVRLPE